MSKKIFFIISKRNQINVQYKIFKNNEEHHLCSKSKIISFMLNISKKKFYIV